MRNARGFNLIELTVVIAVLGVIGALARPEFHRAATRARSAGTMSTMLGVRAIVMGARPVAQKTLPEMSTFVCLYCAQGYQAPKDLRDFRPAWSNDIAHDWGVFGYAEQPYDQWHRPLSADANELEFDQNDCRHDAIWSAGENGIWEGVGANGDEGVGDDLVVGIPFFKQTKEKCGDRFY